MRIAVVGSGISGLGAALRLTQLGRAVTLFEAADRLGGHANTVSMTVGGVTGGVDTGFLVYNDRTYPRLIALFNELGVTAATSDMSFSVRNDISGLEWSGTSLAALFADPRNAIRPRFLRMIADILRFNHRVTEAVRSQAIGDESLGQYLRRNRYGAGFIADYLLPMAACIWSSPKDQILAFPLATFAHFFDNHGLLAIANRPQWRTVAGGSIHYVQQIAARLHDVRLKSAVTQVTREGARVQIACNQTVSDFDAVVFACHSDQALASLAAPTAAEKKFLSAIRYQANIAVLHTDATLMPTRRKAWSAWNYLALDAASADRAAVASLTYWINALQPLPFKDDVFVTLNPARAPDPEKTVRRIEYAHPLFDAEAIAAQKAIDAIQGENRTYYAGAWLGYGFHEDGLASGEKVAARIGAA